MLAVALPHPRLFEIDEVVGAALRALHDAIGPAKLNHDPLAVLEIREVDYGVLECLEAVHGSIVRLWTVVGQVYKYATLNQVRSTYPRGPARLHDVPKNLNAAVADISASWAAESQEGEAKGDGPPSQGPETLTPPTHWDKSAKRDSSPRLRRRAAPEGGCR